MTPQCKRHNRLYCQEPECRNDRRTERRTSAPDIDIAPDPDWQTGSADCGPSTTTD